MSDNINLFDVFQTLKQQQVGGQQAEDVKKGVVDTSGTSTISQSQQIEDSKKAVPAGIPLPIPYISPDYDFKVDIDKIVNMLTKAQAKIMESIFEKWEQNLDKISDMHRRRKIEEALKLVFQYSVQELSRSETTPVSATAMFFITSFVLNAASDGTVFSQPGLSAINGVLGLAQSQGIISTENSKPMAFIGSIFATTSYYPAMLATIREAGGKMEKLSEEAFARHYVDQVIKMAQDPNFHRLVEYALVTTSGMTSLDPKVRDRMVAIYQVMGLFTALGLSYKLETGGVSGTEIADILTGKLTLPRDDPRYLLVQRTKEALARIPQSQAIALVDAYLRYFDRDLDIGDILKTLGLLRGFADSREAQRIRETQV